MRSSEAWRGFSPEELEREYSPSRMIASLDDELSAYAAGSAAVRAAYPFETHAYGSHPDELIDVFPAQRTDAPGGVPFHVFIHGGYWQLLSKDDSSFMAGPIIEGGAAFATVNYTLAPHATFEEITDQAVRAVAWCLEHAERFGADSRRVIVSGHSAGAHLAAVALTRLDGIADAALVSGVYDLEPLLGTSVNDALALDVERARALSPLFLRPARAAPLVVAVGEIEPAEFHRQSANFAAAWAAHGCPVTSFIVPGRHHFNLPNDLGNESTMLGRAVRQLMHGDRGEVEEQSRSASPPGIDESGHPLSVRHGGGGRAQGPPLRPQGTGRRDTDSSRPVS